VGVGIRLTKSAIQIDNMQPGGAGGLPAQSGAQWL